MPDSFFSISFDLILLNRPLTYDLYINSSSLQAREKFVKIVHSGDSVSKTDVMVFHGKYHQLYVREAQRSTFLKSMMQLSEPVELPGASPEETLISVDESRPPRVTTIEVRKTTILKNSAIHHLENLFEKEPSTEVLNETITGCRDVVENMIDVLHTYDVDKLRELIANLSFHDFYTFDHSVNVSMYCILIYQTLHPLASRTEIMQAGLAGLLHDLGKIKIPTEIINNSGKLSDLEFKEIQKHPDFGQDLLLQSALSWPEDLNPPLLGKVVCQHHENWDGTGYPRKIAGEQIHEMARITAIADFFDAITTKRSYSEPLSIEDAVALMGKFVGKKLDPKLFQFFVQNTEKIAKKHHSNLTLTDDDFDPCQPHQSLPLAVASQSATVTANAKDIGQVKVLKTDSKVDIGKVKVIEEPKPLQFSFGKVKVLNNDAPNQQTNAGLLKKKSD